MSSEEGALSLQSTSEETFEHICDPCHHHGIQKEATSFCNDCQETFCRHCTDSHSGKKISRNHKIVSVGELAGRIVSKQASLCRVLCECSQNLEVSICCQDHDDVFCPSCRIIKHRSCKTASLDEKGDAYVKMNFPILEQKAKNLIVEIDKVINQNKSNQESKDSLKEFAKHDISHSRQKVIRQLDLMEQQILKELDERDAEKQQEIDHNILSCTTVKQMLQKDLNLINDVSTASFDVSMFAADVKVSKRLIEYERLLQDIRWETKSSILTFRRNEQLFDMLETMDVIGTLSE